MKWFGLYWWSRNRLKEVDGCVVIDCKRNAILYTLMDISGIKPWDLVKKILDEQ